MTMAVHDSGSAYIFSRNQGGIPDNWGQVKKLMASDKDEYNYFGYSVAISGDTVVVGAWGNDDAGFQNPVQPTSSPVIRVEYRITGAR